MKEFIKKLIGRLEEYKYSHLVEHEREMLEHCAGNESGKHCDGIDCFWCVWDKSIEIVNELAEEYKAFEMSTGSEGFCEWRLIDYEANVYDTTCRNPHILLEGSPTDNSYEFCPYCGRKIKVAPYTKGE